MKTSVIRVLLPGASALWGVYVVTPAGYGSGGMLLIGASLIGLLSATVERKRPFLLSAAASLALVVAVIWSNWTANAQIATLTGWTPYIIGDIALAVVTATISFAFTYVVRLWRKPPETASRE